MSQPISPEYQAQKENKNQTRKTVLSASVFGVKLISELKDIIKAKFDTEISDMEAQEIGRHIAQFVLLKESLGGFDPSAIGKIRERWI